ncbi:uncharacterized mitochondrial protein-like protein [Tanacetum coccineum]
MLLNHPKDFKIPSLSIPEKFTNVLVKALYGLHQAPRAWYETLDNYLLGNGFKRGKIDQTLFIKKQKGDILLVHVYLDNIIFGSTNKELCNAIEKLMKDNRDKYAAEILKKFNYTYVKSAFTPVDLEKPLVKYGYADDVDVHLCRSMIGSLMYLTASSQIIMVLEYACVRFKLPPKTSHLIINQRNYRKSYNWSFQFLGKKVDIMALKEANCELPPLPTEAEYVGAASCCEQLVLTGTKSITRFWDKFP